jgi:hypothetical protein
VRLSTRLLSNAATNYLRMGATFALGLFTTWYVVGAAGVVGFGLISLAVSSSGPSRALERTLRLGLVRELSAALATGDAAAIRRSIASAFRLCSQAILPLAVVVAALAVVAWAGLFNVPGGRGPLTLALAALILAEGLNAAARLLAAPLLQCLFASQQVALDNLLMVLGRLTHALSALVVFGWLLPDAALPVQLAGFAVSRVTLQLADVAAGVLLARRRIPAVELDRALFDREEYGRMRQTVWSFSQVTVLLNILPRFMAILINLFFGIAYNAIWEITVQFAGYAWVASEGLLRGIAPLTAHLQEGGRGRVALGLMARSIRYHLVVVLPAALLLGLYSKPLLQLWVGGRLAADANLESAGLSVQAALGLAAAMATVLLAGHTVRAGLFGVERILYGMGEVRSYAWFSKWAALGSVATAAAAMAVFGEPMAAPLAILAALCGHSLGAVLGAAHRRMGLPIGHTLRRSLPRPLIANLLFLAVLLASRPWFAELTPPRLGVLLLGAGIVYGAIALLVTPEPDERPRLAELARQLPRLLRRRPPAAGAGTPPGDD